MTKRTTRISDMLMVTTSTKFLAPSITIHSEGYGEDGVYFPPQEIPVTGTSTLLALRGLIDAELVRTKEQHP